MKFGVKVKDDTSSASEGTSGGAFIKYFGKGETTVRFLEEIGEWTKFYDHFNQSKKRSYPCTGDRDTCPGCTSQDERERQASVRYLVNLYRTTTDEQYVDVYKIPVSIKADLERYSDKDGSIMLRDYTVVQFREDDRVKYSVDREDKAPIDLSEKQKHLKDHQKMLNDAYHEVWGTPGVEEEPEEKPAPRVVRSTPKAQEEPEQKITSVQDWAEAKGDIPPTEPAAQQSEPQQEEPQQDAQDDVELDEDDLRNMTADQVRTYFKYTSTEAPDTDDVDSLVDALIDAL